MDTSRIASDIGMLVGGKGCSLISGLLMQTAESAGPELPRNFVFQEIGCKTLVAWKEKRS